MDPGNIPLTARQCDNARRWKELTAILENLIQTTIKKNASQSANPR